MIHEELVQNQQSLTSVVSGAMALLGEQFMKLESRLSELKRTALLIGIASSLILSLGLTACAPNSQVINPRYATAEAIAEKYTGGLEEFERSPYYYEALQGVETIPNLWNSTVQVNFSDGISESETCTGLAFSVKGVNYVTTANHCLQEITAIDTAIISQPQKSRSKLEFRVEAERTYGFSDIRTFRMSPKDDGPKFPEVHFNTTVPDGSRIHALALPVGHIIPIYNQITRDTMELNSTYTINEGPQIFYVDINYLIPGGSGTPVFNDKGEVIGFFTEIISPQTGVTGALFIPSPDLSINLNLP